MHFALIIWGNVSIKKKTTTEKMTYQLKVLAALEIGLDLSS